MIEPKQKYDSANPKVWRLPFSKQSMIQQNIKYDSIPFEKQSMIEHIKKYHGIPFQKQSMIQHIQKVYWWHNITVYLKYDSIPLFFSDASEMGIHPFTRAHQKREQAFIQTTKPCLSCAPSSRGQPPEAEKHRCQQKPVNGILNYYWTTKFQKRG